MSGSPSTHRTHRTHRTRRSLRWLRGLSLVLSLCACDGPMLTVGERKLTELDASQASDANQASDAPRVRNDAQDDDWEDWRENQLCRDVRDCLGNLRRRRCHPGINRCVECLDDRECPDGRCNEETGLCRETDKPRP